MNVGVIGHTSGIGKAIFEQFDGAVGLSRTTGHYMGDIAVMKKAIEAHELDTIIINAYDGFTQVELLYELWDKWKDKDKIIVCISSEAGDNCYRKSHSYAIHKNALDEACKQLSRIDNATCKILNVKPGYVDTPRVETIQAKKIDPVELAFLVKSMIVLSDTMWVTSVTVMPK